jgi:hypothetical protein
MLRMNERGWVTWFMAAVLVGMLVVAPGSGESSLASTSAADAATAADDADNAAADEAGFEPLFDGQTLAGWEGDKSLWKVVDGAIVGDSPGIQHNQFLATEKTFADFELRLQFKLHDGKGNSGVQFRSKRVEGSSEVSGYQADIGEGCWGSLYDESRRNKFLAQASKDVLKHIRLDDWNDYTIRAEKNWISLTINGHTSVAFTETEASIAKSGFIAVQVHSGPPMKVEFRNIRVKSL